MPYAETSAAAARYTAPGNLPAEGRAHDRSPRIVALGGGTGLSVLLRGLRSAYVPPGITTASTHERLTAIVAVTDDGGSSGSLRRHFGILPPGDIRNCLLALSDADTTMQSLFDFRFDNQVDGHSLGNLMLAALTLMENDFARAVERASGLLAVRGQVLPSTTEQVQLVAEFADGGRLAGETSIAAARGTIRQVSLSPSTAHALPQAKAAIAAADLVVLGPGSLYTSLIPNLLVEDIAESISKSSARVVLVMNLMTEPGETDGYSASDVLYAIHRHAPQVRIHTVLLNKTPIPEGLALRYTVEGAAPIRADIEAIEAAGCRPVERRLLGSGPFIRHDPFKLAHALLEMTEDPSS